MMSFSVIRLWVANDKLPFTKFIFAWEDPPTYSITMIPIILK